VSQLLDDPTLICWSADVVVVTETGVVPAIPVNAENIGSMTALISHGF
jgi:hypothetical protein